MLELFSIRHLFVKLSLVIVKVPPGVLNDQIDAPEQTYPLRVSTIFSSFVEVAVGVS